jgi:hypothetical protein
MDSWKEALHSVRARPSLKGSVGLTAESGFNGAIGLYGVETSLLLGAMNTEFLALLW